MLQCLQYLTVMPDWKAVFDCPLQLSFECVAPLPTPISDVTVYGHTQEYTPASLQHGEKLKRHSTNFTYKYQFICYSEYYSACENSRIVSSVALETFFFF